MHNILNQTNILTSTRNNIQKIMDNYSLEQLSAIPAGFSNNLIWNYGHVVVTHQLLTYGLSGVEMKIEDEVISKYRKGSKPESIISEQEYDFLKSKFSELPQQFHNDRDKDLFTDFKNYETSYGITLNSIEDATTFNNLHEALHFGVMLSIRKFL